MFGNNPFDLRGGATQETVLSELTPAQKDMKTKAQGGITGRQNRGIPGQTRSMGMGKVDHQGRGLKKTHKPGDRTTGYSGDYRTAQARKSDAETGKIANMAYKKSLRKKDPKNYSPDSKLSDLRRKHSAKIGRDMDGNKVKESVYVIPEEIPANERTAFHGAAAAAAKAGKKSFNFGGKTHPVTMKKDTAKQIPTTKSEGLDDKDKSTLLKVAKKLKGASAAHAGQSKQIMKDLEDGYYKDLATNKSEPKPKSQKDVAKDFKKRRGMSEEKEMDPRKHVAKSKKNPDMFCVFDKDGNEVKLFKDKKDAEQFAIKNHDMLMGKKKVKEMTFREKLIDTINEFRSEKHAKDHYKKTPPPETFDDLYTGKGAKDMMEPAKDAIKNPALDAEDVYNKQGKKIGNAEVVKKSKMRTTDKDQGDKNIVEPGTPMKDPIAPKNEETFTTIQRLQSIQDAYNKMVEENRKDIDEMQVYRIGHKSIGGNVHAKNEKDGVAQLRKKGVKGKITLTHKGPAPKTPKLS